MRPMLATRGQKPPQGPGWLHEIKWDGVRALVEVIDGTVRVTSRSEREITKAFPELVTLSALPNGLVLDGEIVAVARGDEAPTFAAIADRVHVVGQKRAAALAEAVPATLMVFDLLACEGQSVMGLALADRRRLLEALELTQFTDASVQLSPAFDDGVVLLDAARDQGLEGIVSKRRDSAYRPGRRSEDWLKFPLRTSASFVIAGYRLEKGGLRVGSLLLGEPTSAGLAYRGRVGLGVSHRSTRMLAELLDASRAVGPPFADSPEADTHDVRWVQPIHIVEVEFLARTADGRLRHPVYLGLRSDLSLDDLG